MRGGLFTSPGAKRAGNVLLGPIFSGPDDCADLVNFSQHLVIKQFWRFPFKTLRCRWRSTRWNRNRTFATACAPSWAVRSTCFVRGLVLRPPFAATTSNVAVADLAAVRWACISSCAYRAASRKSGGFRTSVVWEGLTCVHCVDGAEMNASRLQTLASNRDRTMLQSKPAVTGYAGLTYSDGTGFLIHAS